MSELRDKYKKLTGENSKIEAVYDVENCSSGDFKVKMFSPRYVDWLERKLANVYDTSDSNCNIPHVVFSEAELKAKLEEQKEEMRQWLEGEGYELLAERI